MPTHPKIKQTRDLMRVLIKTAESTRLAPMRETERVAVYSALQDAYYDAMNAEAVILNPEHAEMNGYDFRDGWDGAVLWFNEARVRMIDAIKAGHHLNSFTPGSVALVPQVLRRYRNSKSHWTPKEARS